MNRLNNDHIIDRGHLAPSGDFITTNLKRASFNMINIVPQFKPVDNGNWRQIEGWTRDNARGDSNICTGVIDCNLDSQRVSNLDCVVRLDSDRNQMVPMFLGRGRKIPIPLWTWKIVKNPSVVFLTLNNIYHKGRVSEPVQICSRVPCPSITLDASTLRGMTFCCNYNDFITRNFPYLRNIC